LPTLVAVSDQTCDGVTRRATLSDRAATVRDQLADAARAYAWGRTFELLAEHPEFASSGRPDGATWFALEVLLELDRPELWFAVPGMYGGFSIRLEAAGPTPTWH